MKTTSPLPYQRLKTRLLLLSIALFIISLTQNAYSGTNYHVKGIQPFLIGGIFFFTPSSWWANPLLVYSWVSIWLKPVRSLITSLTAVMLASGFLLIKKDPTVDAPNPILSYNIGYWLWVGSIFIMLIGSFWVWLNEREDQMLNS